MLLKGDELLFTNQDLHFRVQLSNLIFSYGDHGTIYFFVKYFYLFLTHLQISALCKYVKDRYWCCQHLGTSHFAQVSLLRSHRIRSRFHEPAHSKKSFLVKQSTDL